jgi:SAM-dependent methyltransferase
VVPGDPLFGNRRRANSFGDDAEQYDRVRPSYPTEMIDLLLGERPVTVLDVGCGTGITSRLFSGRGCTVIGVEPDPRMAAVARRHGVSVEDGLFESWDARGRHFDLLIAGQSWHWVDPRAGAEKAATVLRPGGRVGLFWNQAQPGPGIRPVMSAAYAQHAPALGQHSVLIGRRDGSLYEGIADALRASGRFGEISVRLFTHDETYSTEAWLELATTHSDHRTLPPEQLGRLLGALRTGIDDAGGRVDVHYETTLVTGRTR